ncbi:MULTISPECIES: hypothetical protein [unclassified Rhodococcus (in: high G+C Gram-positive bacteria)]|uniref:hypothetical protein n=1 Tax=unclassified Rhodococcus (in: high G+C Gram-positive bacteria) TaxID=192944 RepID=UPI00117ABD11|nr:MULTISPECIES: hypothetical protein [unclassified Rhodococcus (in: high G+C Gram-positive bacteria)]
MEQLNTNTPQDHHPVPSLDTRQQMPQRAIQAVTIAEAATEVAGSGTAAANTADSSDEDLVLSDFYKRANVHGEDVLVGASPRIGDQSSIGTLIREFRKSKHSAD